MNITEIQQALSSRKFSCEKITSDYLHRIEKYDGTLHSFCNVTKERAIQEARDADSAMHKGKKIGSLHGVPYAVKDHFNVAGEPTTAGCSMLANNNVNDDATAVHKLKAAGMILLSHVRYAGYHRSDDHYS